VDYLRYHADLVEVWFIEEADRLECVWAQLLVALPGAGTPVARFGASDCHCPSHLFRFSTMPDERLFASRAAGKISVERFPT
jgi:Uri superfamily endonuclease